MKKFEGSTLLISIVAMLISVSGVVYTGFISQKLSSSDYQAEEQVKTDTAKLLSTLRSIMHKGALSSQTTGKVDFSHERRAISDFTTSQTGLAYYSWVDEKSSEAKKEGRAGESWRLFFLYLAELSNENDAYVAARRAADVEILFDQLTEGDISRISRFNSNLASAIAHNSKNRSGNVVISVFFSMQTESQEERSSDNFSAKLRYLKSIGIEDPNIDLFLGAMGDDDNIDAVRDALEAGAEVNMSDSALLAKYANELKSFE